MVLCFAVTARIFFGTFEEFWACLDCDKSACCCCGSCDCFRGCSGFPVPGPITFFGAGPRGTYRSISFLILDVFQNNQGPMSKLRWRVRTKILYVLSSGLSYSSSLEIPGSSSRCVLAAPVAGSQKDGVREELCGEANHGVGNVPRVRLTT